MTESRSSYNPYYNNHVYVPNDISSCCASRCGVPFLCLCHVLPHSLWYAARGKGWAVYPARLVEAVGELLRGIGASVPTVESIAGESSGKAVLSSLEQSLELARTSLNGSNGTGGIVVLNASNDASAPSLRQCPSQGCKRKRAPNCTHDLCKLCCIRRQRKAIALKQHGWKKQQHKQQQLATSKPRAGGEEMWDAAGDTLSVESSAGETNCAVHCVPPRGKGKGKKEKKGIGQQPATSVGGVGVGEGSAGGGGEKEETGVAEGGGCGEGSAKKRKKQTGGTDVTEGTDGTDGTEGWAGGLGGKETEETSGKGGSGRCEQFESNVHGAEYIASARVLLVGVGADEMMAGYGRHRTAFTKVGLVQMQILTLPHMHFLHYKVVFA